MKRVNGVVLLAQESRIRLLTDDGRGLIFLLSHAAPIEPQDLPLLIGARVRLSYENSPRLVAGIMHDLVVLEEIAA